MALVTAGLMNKQIAAELGMSEITVKVHRGNVTRKDAAPNRWPSWCGWRTGSACGSINQSYLGHFGGGSRGGGGGGVGV